MTVVNVYKRTIVPAVACVFLSAALFAQKPDALAMYRNGNYEEAARVCRQEIEGNPNNLDSYVVLCWALNANRDYAEADAWAERARSIRRYDERIIEAQGEAKFYRGQNNAALALFQEYVGLVSASGSRLAEVYYYMGEIYIRQTKYNHADIAFSHAVLIEPQRDYYWTRLGYSKEMAGDYRGAAQAYEQALKINPQRAEARQGNERVSAKLQ